MIRLEIIGNLTRDPELRSLPGGEQVCNFTVAAARRTAPGKEEKTEFVQVAAWGKKAEPCARYLQKGKKVYAEGEAEAAAYQKKDGSVAASLRMTAREVLFLTPGGQGRQESAEEEKGGAAGYASGFVPVDDEELPF